MWYIERVAVLIISLVCFSFSPWILWRNWTKLPGLASAAQSTPTFVVADLAPKPKTGMVWSSTARSHSHSQAFIRHSHIHSHTVIVIAFPHPHPPTHDAYFYHPTITHHLTTSQPSSHQAHSRHLPWVHSKLWKPAGDWVRFLCIFVLPSNPVKVHDGIWWKTCKFGGRIPYSNHNILSFSTLILLIPTDQVGKPLHNVSYEETIPFGRFTQSHNLSTWKKKGPVAMMANQGSFRWL